MNILIKPSTLLATGLRTEKINNLTLFKFTDELGERLQLLLDKQKSDSLIANEAIELETLGELDDFFSYINATIVAQAHANP